MSPYDTNLDKNGANHIPLTPLSFLERAKDVYPDYEAIVYEDRKYTWSEVFKRATKFASALEKIGVGKGDLVREFFYGKVGCAALTGKPLKMVLAVLISENFIPMLMLYKV